MKSCRKKNEVTNINWCRPWFIKLLVHKPPHTPGNGGGFPDRVLRNRLRSFCGHGHLQLQLKCCTSMRKVEVNRETHRHIQKTLCLPHKKDDRRQRSHTGSYWCDNMGATSPRKCCLDKQNQLRVYSASELSTWLRAPHIRRNAKAGALSKATVWSSEVNKSRENNRKESKGPPSLIR